VEHADVSLEEGKSGQSDVWADEESSARAASGTRIDLGHGKWVLLLYWPRWTVSPDHVTGKSL